MGEKEPPGGIFLERRLQTSAGPVYVREGGRGDVLEDASGPREAHELGGVRGPGSEGSQGPGALFGSPYCEFSV